MSTPLGTTVRSSLGITPLVMKRSAAASLTIVMWSTRRLVSRYEARWTGAALVDAVDGGDQGRDRGEEAKHPGHQVGVQHVAVQDIRPPGPDDPDQPRQPARIGKATPHLERSDRDAGALSLQPHRAQASQGDDENLVPPGLHFSGGGEDLLVRAAHPHAGREQQHFHRSRSPDPPRVRRTTRFNTVGQYGYTSRPNE